MGVQRIRWLTLVETTLQMKSSALITFSFFNLDTMDKLAQAEIISADYETKNAHREKSNIYKSTSTNRDLDL